MHRQTARSPSSLTIRYRHHPHFNRVVEVVRSFGEGLWLVRLTNEVQCVIPAWMFDATCCDLLIDAEQPLIAARALIELHELIAAQRLLEPAAIPTSDESPQPGGRHAAEQGDHSTASTKARVRTRSHMGAASQGSDAGSQKPTRAGTAGRRTSRSPGKEPR